VLLPRPRRASSGSAAIRSGALDDRLGEVRDLVWASVRDKLAVANPNYLPN
jgi:hypothetical protein